MVSKEEKNLLTELLKLAEEFTDIIDQAGFDFDSACIYASGYGYTSVQIHDEFGRGVHVSKSNGEVSFSEIRKDGVEDVEIG